MKRSLLILLMAATAATVSAQTPPKPATHTATAAPATGARPAATGVKLPPGVPLAPGLVKTAFSLRYQEIKVGAGAEAQYRKVDTVHYTGWLGADGRKFDSSYARQNPILDEKHMPVMGADGKPKMSDPHPEPFQFIEGDPRLIPGWNLGIEGMKVGGKRRIFVPWQMAYGAQGRPGPDAAHPGIPPKADLIFDIELLDVKEMQMPSSHPGMSIAPHPATPAQPGAGVAPAAPATTVTPSAPGTPAAPAGSAAPAPAATPPQPAATPAQSATPPQPK